MPRGYDPFGLRNSSSALHHDMVLEEARYALEGKDGTPALSVLRLGLALGELRRLQDTSDRVLRLKNEVRRAFRVVAKEVSDGVSIDIQQIRRRLKRESGFEQFRHLDRLRIFLETVEYFQSRSDMDFSLVIVNESEARGLLEEFSVRIKPQEKEKFDDFTDAISSKFQPPKELLCA